MAICSDELALGQAGSSCRVFDFRLSFHAGVLDVLPAAIFLAASLPWVRYLLSQEIKLQKSRGSQLLWSGKLFCSSIALVGHLVALAAWSTDTPISLRSSLTYAMVILDFLASLVLPLVSSLEHHRRFRSSVLLQSFLAISILFDCARIRNFALVDVGTFYLAAFCTALSGRAFLLLLEQRHKTAWLLPAYTQKKASREVTAGLFERLTITWFIPYLFVGWKRQLKMEDLGEISYENPEEQYATFEAAWKKSAEGKFGLMRAIWMSTGLAMFYPILPVLLNALFNIGSPVLLRATLQFMTSRQTSEPEPLSYGYALAVAYGILGMGLVLSNAAYELSLFRLQARIRAVAAQAVYRKSLRLKITAAEDIGSGALASYISVDVERIIQAIRFPYVLLQFCAIFGIGLYLLYQEMGPTFVSAILSIIVLAIVIPIVGRKLTQDQTAWSRATDRRVKLLTSFLKSWKSSKLANYECSLYQKYSECRQVELKEQFAYKFRNATLGSLNDFLWFALQAAVIVSFAMLAYLSPNFTFDRVSVFTIFAVINASSGVFWGLQWALGDVYSSISSSQRLQDLLVKPERHYPTCSPGSSDSKLELEKANDVQDIQFLNATIGYKEKSISILEQLTCTIPTGKVTAIIGTVGCGKSTLCSTLLGETDILSGTVLQPKVRRAFCSQDAFVIDGSIKDNILLGSPMDRPFYDTCIKATALEEDLRLLSVGDEHPAGRLSGGQRARVALARALYTRADIYILDDVFAALDKNTKRMVLDALFGKDGLLLNSTTVLVTNNLAHLSEANHVIQLGQGGMLLYEGAPKDVSAKDTRSSEKTRLDIPEAVSVEAKTELQTNSESKINSVDEEASLDQGIVWPSVWLHCKAAGMRLTLVGLVLSLCWTWGSESVGWAIYLDYWTGQTEAERQSNNAIYVGGFVGATIALGLATAGWWYCWKAYHPIRGAKQLHDGQIRGLFRSGLSSIEHFSSGFIINRFSSDLISYESDFIESLCVFFSLLAMLAGQIVVCIIATRYALAIIAVTLVIGWLCSRIYLRTSSQLRSLQQSSKTPLYEAISATSDLNGLRVIRAHGKEDAFIERTTSAILAANLPYYLLQAARNLFNVVLGIFAAGLAICVVCVAVTQDGSNTFLAVALLSVVGLPSNLMDLFRQITDLEVHAVSISRMQMIANLPTEDKDYDPLSKSNQHLSAGSIIFDKVNLRYTPHANLALNNLSFDIPAGKRVGVCGRTGSGKSSTLSALFRMVEIESGSISINGLDTMKSSRYELRDAMTIIPQDPLLLELTIRENLDPEAHYTDAQIWSALDKASARSIVENLPGKLDHDVKCDGDSISRGQRQLLALCRALLRNRPILCLDEASSSLDDSSDSAIQRTLRTSFGQTTMLIVAHRISTISDLDWILVMDNGTIVEQGEPRELLRIKGKFASLAWIGEK